MIIIVINYQYLSMGRNDARMSLTLPPELKAEFAKIAEANGRSLSQELIVAIRNHIISETKKDKPSDAELDMRIEKAVRKIIQEMQD
ncbi:Arc family DNA-binding protein [Methanocorpusculum sp.]|nr:Arc family DNA-binding protein [Methanocorpusculum sp.]MBO5432317.1 Arc family DNA-binding protein [Methanocorpusculum sp.]